MADSEPAGLTAAKRLAACGWRVYPGFVSKDDEKVPYSGKGGSWVKLATCEFAQLEKWWADKPYLWPGVVGGKGSPGVITIDADGVDAVALLREKALELGWSDSGLIYRTPGRSGGLHAHFDFPSFMDPSFRLAKVLLETGGVIELRGAGCWTLTAGAKRKVGSYEILAEPPLMGGSLAPQRLLEWIVAESVTIGYGTGDGSLKEISPEDAALLGLVYDGRKNYLAGLCWYLACRGRWEESDAALVLDFGLNQCVPPLSISTIESKWNYAVGRAEKMRAETQAIMNAMALNRNREF